MNLFILSSLVIAIIKKILKNKKKLYRVIKIALTTILSYFFNLLNWENTIELKIEDVIGLKRFVQIYCPQTYSYRRFLNNRRENSSQSSVRYGQPRHARRHFAYTIHRYCIRTMISWFIIRKHVSSTYKRRLDLKIASTSITKCIVNFLVI